MDYLQLRVNYNGNSPILYRDFLGPLQSEWAQRYFFRWTVGKSWQNGPHLLLTLDAHDYFFDTSMRNELSDRVERFLAEHPSPPYDVDKYLSTQTLLNELEGANIDPSWVAPNNSYDIRLRDIDMLAAKYETPEQWRSIFNTEVKLRPLVIRQWQESTDHQRFVCELLTLLACVYPPQPSDDPEVNEYNGFLSFHSNFRFWHHRLPAAQQSAIDERFSSDYAADRQRYLEWLDALEADLARGEARKREVAELLVDSFLDFTQMANAGIIHARSPYPKELVAPKDAVSDFHRRYFYAADGSAYQFNRAFSGYRWLLNIVYRNLPLFDVSPLKRQYFNFSLDRLQREKMDTISRVRQGMLTPA